MRYTYSVHAVFQNVTSRLKILEESHIRGTITSERLGETLIGLSYDNPLNLNQYPIIVFQLKVYLLHFFANT